MRRGVRQELAVIISLGFLLACRLSTQPLPTSAVVAATAQAATVEMTPLPVTVAPSQTARPPATGSPTAPPNIIQSTTPIAVETLTATETPAPVPEEPDIRPHYTITATVDYEAHFVHVLQTVAITNTTAAPWNELVLHTAPAYWPGIFSLESVELVVQQSTFTPEAVWDVTMMHLALPQPLAPGAALQLTLRYGLDLPQLDPLGWGPTGNAGWGPELMQVGDWYPALVPYRQGEGWQGWRYHPVGDPVRSLNSDFDVTITAPPDLVVAGAGHRATSEGVHHFRLRSARAFAFLASPNYVRYDGASGDIPIRVYVLPRHADMGAVVVEAAAQSLALFEDAFGPFPYDELVIAENGFLTAMEYSALISLSGYAFTAYEGSPDSLLVSITSHEVAHQWWYGAVGNDQVDEPWLDEALAMVSELLFYERTYPDLVDWWWYYRVERWEPSGTVDVSTTNYDDSATFVHDMYGMAAYFMRDLRTVMGEETFKAFLQAYYDAHRDGWATGDDFFATALEFLPAEPLRELATVYFQRMPEPLLP